MEYKYLEKTYRDDVVAEALHSRETEIYHYELDIENFTMHLDTLDQDDPARASFEKRIQDTEVQLGISRAIYESLLKQAAKDPVAHAEAVARTELKRAAAKIQ